MSKSYLHPCGIANPNDPGVLVTLAHGNHVWVGQLLNLTPWQIHLGAHNIF